MNYIRLGIVLNFIFFSIHAWAIDTTITVLPGATLSHIAESYLKYSAYDKIYSRKNQKGFIDAIAERNNIKNENRIYMGQSLILPLKQASPAELVRTPSAGRFYIASDQKMMTYVVQQGDTLSNIALHYLNQSIYESRSQKANLPAFVYAIAQYNKLANLNRIAMGQKLLIPTGDRKLSQINEHPEHPSVVQSPKRQGAPKVKTSQPTRPKEKHIAKKEVLTLPQSVPEKTHLAVAHNAPEVQKPKREEIKLQAKSMPLSPPRPPVVKKQTVKEEPLALPQPAPETKQLAIAQNTPEIQKPDPEVQKPNTEEQKVTRAPLVEKEPLTPEEMQLEQPALFTPPFYLDGFWGPAILSFDESLSGAALKGFSQDFLSFGGTLGMWLDQDWGVELSAFSYPLNITSGVPIDDRTTRMLSIPIETRYALFTTKKFVFAPKLGLEFQDMPFMFIGSGTTVFMSSLGLLHATAGIQILADISRRFWLDYNASFQYPLLTFSDPALSLQSYTSKLNLSSEIKLGYRFLPLLDFGIYATGLYNNADLTLTRPSIATTNTGNYKVYGLVTGFFFRIKLDSYLDDEEK